MAERPSSYIAQEWSVHAQVTISHRRPDVEVTPATPRDDEGVHMEYSWDAVPGTTSNPRPCYGFQRGNIVFTTRPSSCVDGGVYGSLPARRPAQAYDRRCKSTCSITLARPTVSRSNSLNAGTPCEVCDGDRSPSSLRRAANYTTHFCTRLPDKTPTPDVAKQSQDAASQTHDDDDAAATSSKPVQPRMGNRLYPKRKSVTDLLQIPSLDVPETVVEAAPTYKPTKRLSRSPARLSGRKSSSRSPDSATKSQGHKPRTVHIDVYCTGSDASDASSSSSSLDSDAGASWSSPQTVFESDEVRVVHTRAGKDSLPQGLVQRGKDSLSQALLQQQTARGSDNKDSLSQALLQRGSDSKGSQPQAQLQQQTARGSDNKDSLSQALLQRGHDSKDSLPQALLQQQTVRGSDSKDSLSQALLRRGYDSKDSLSQALLRQQTARGYDSDDGLSSQYPSQFSSCTSFQDSNPSRDPSSSTLSSSSWRDTVTDDLDSVLQSNPSLATCDSFEYADSIDRLRIKQRERAWAAVEGSKTWRSPQSERRRMKLTELPEKRLNSDESEDDDDETGDAWSFGGGSSSRVSTLKREDTVRKATPAIPPPFPFGSRSPSPAPAKIANSVTSPFTPRAGLRTDQLSRAERFGPIVGAFRKPGHHVGPSKNPECGCAHCRHFYFEQDECRGRTRSLDMSLEAADNWKTRLQQQIADRRLSKYEEQWDDSTAV